MCPPAPEAPPADQKLTDRCRPLFQRYTLKLAPAVSHKELERALSEAHNPDEHRKTIAMKPRVELVCDVENLKRIADL